MSGNFASRFTDFLTSDGEKPWRRREEEFAERGDADLTRHNANPQSERPPITR